MSATLTAPLDLRRPQSGDTRALLWLALPMIGVSLSRMLMQFLDVWMVSFLDTAALAAVSPAGITVFALGCIGMGTSQAVQTFVSQADGRGEQHRAGSYVAQVYYIALATFVLTLPLVWYVDVWYGSLARVGKHPPDVLARELEYLRWCLWSIAPITICFGLENFFNGVQRPRVTLVAVLASLGMNLVLNYLLIFGKFGFPRMEIAGAALATVIGWWVRVAVLLFALLQHEVHARFRTRTIALHARELIDLLKVGGPTGLQWLIDIGAWVVFLQVMIPPFGDAAMAAGNIAIQYMHLSFMPALGIGMALTTQVGFAIGAGRPDEAVRRVRVARRLILGYMGGMGVVFILGSTPLAWSFSRDANVIALAAIALTWTALFQFSDGVCVTYSFALRGAGDTRVPALLFGACCWGIFVLGGVSVTTLAPSLDIHGPWSMCTLYIIVLGVLLWRRFHSEEWRKIRLLDRKPAPADPPATEALEAGAIM
jgi:MATE family multidrug resistance protein